MFGPQFGPRFPWSVADQSLLLIAYYLGGTITAIPSGILIDKFEIAKSFIGYSFFIAAVMVGLSPLASSWSLGALCATRFIIGFFFVGLFVI